MAGSSYAVEGSAKSAEASCWRTLPGIRGFAAAGSLSLLTIIAIVLSHYLPKRFSFSKFSMWAMNAMNCFIDFAGQRSSWE